MMPRQVIGITLLFVWLISCQENRVFEQNQPVEVTGWSYQHPLTYTVNIPDTARLYNVFVNVRHTDTYGYNNLWLILETTLPDSTRLTDKVQVSLAVPEGEWTGTCMDGICYHSVLIRNQVTFPQQGAYQMQLTQDMREDPLPGLLDVGIRIESL